jgi:hypothetical protein
MNRLFDMHTNIKCAGNALSSPSRQSQRTGTRERRKGDRGLCPISTTPDTAVASRCIQHPDLASTLCVTLNNFLIPNHHG